MYFYKYHAASHPIVRINVISAIFEWLCFRSKFNLLKELYRLENFKMIATKIHLGIYFLSAFMIQV